MSLDQRKPSHNLKKKKRHGRFEKEKVNWYMHSIRKHRAGES